jgi:hypothetical protein
MPEEDRPQGGHAAPGGGPSYSRGNSLAGNRAVRFVLVLVFAGMVGSSVMFLSRFMPDYVAVALVFLAGMVGLGFLLGVPRRQTLFVWLLFGLGWASAICLIYSRGLGWRSNQSHAWYWVGIGFAGLLAALVAIESLLSKLRRRQM